MTLEELYNEMLADDELKAELAQTVNGEETLVDFLHKHGCDATWDEYKAFMIEKRGIHEMDDKELEQVAGGSVGTIIGSVCLWWTAPQPRSQSRSARKTTASSPCGVSPRRHG